MKKLLTLLVLLVGMGCAMPEASANSRREFDVERAYQRIRSLEAQIQREREAASRHSYLGPILLTSIGGGGGLAMATTLGMMYALSGFCIMRSCSPNPDYGTAAAISLGAAAVMGLVGIVLILRTGHRRRPYNSRIRQLRQEIRVLRHDIRVYHQRRDLRRLGKRSSRRRSRVAQTRKPQTRRTPPPPSASSRVMLRSSF